MKTVWPIKFAELVTVLIVRYLFRFILKASNVEKWQSPLNDPGASFLIVANHSSAMDPFFITSYLNWRQIIDLRPYYFMTHSRFFRFWPLRPWLFLHGCFPSHEYRNFGYGLGRAKQLLDQGRTVIIFPEGGVLKPGRHKPPKNGVAVLANQEKTLLIPVRVKWDRNKGLWKSYSLSIGKPFSGKNMTAEQIMDVVYSLKFR